MMFYEGQKVRLRWDASRVFSVVDDDGSVVRVVEEKDPGVKGIAKSDLVADGDD